MVATERICVTADRQTAVSADDLKACYLLKAKGQEIERVIVEKYGIIDGRVKKKQHRKPGNKMVGGVKNKSGGK